jgi:transposase-like protein
MVNRRKYSAEFKAKVVLDIIANGKSISAASREYKIKDSVLSRWKAEFIERSASVFRQEGQQQDRRDERIAELERMVGKMAMELEASKKVSSILKSL